MKKKFMHLGRKKIKSVARRFGCAELRVLSLTGRVFFIILCVLILRWLSSLLMITMSVVWSDRARNRHAQTMNYKSWCYLLSTRQWGAYELSGRIHTCLTGYQQSICCNNPLSLWFEPINDKQASTSKQPNSHVIKQKIHSLKILDISYANPFLLLFHCLVLDSIEHCIL